MRRPPRRRPGSPERMSAQEYLAALSPAAAGKPSGSRRFVIPPEHRLQIDVTKWLRLALPESRLAQLEVWWTAIDHAAAHSALVGRLRKARGVRPGIPDYWFLFRGRVITIELKTDDGDTSDSQDATQIALEAAGAWWHCARSGEAVEAILRRHGLPLMASFGA